MRRWFLAWDNEVRERASRWFLFLKHLKWNNLVWFLNWCCLDGALVQSDWAKDHVSQSALSLPEKTVISIKSNASSIFKINWSPQIAFEPITVPGFVSFFSFPNDITATGRSSSFFRPIRIHGYLNKDQLRYSNETYNVVVRDLSCSDNETYYVTVMWHIT